MFQRVQKYMLTIGPAFLIAGSLLGYWYALWHFHLNAAQGDDFVDILWFFEIFLTRDSWLEKLDAIALANHEHITVLNHLVYLLHYKIAGHVNFMHYVWIGQAFVLATCGVMARWLSNRVNPWVATAIAVSCYVNLFFWDSCFWPMTAISNQAVIFFAVLTAYSYQKNPDDIAWPLLWSFAATASQFNGLCVFLAFFMALLFDVWRGQRAMQSRQIMAVLLMLVVVSAAYAWRENPFAVMDHLDRHVMYTEPELLPEYHRVEAVFPESSALIRQFFFWVPATLPLVLGSSVWAVDQVVPSLITGMVMLGLFSWQAYRRPASLDRFSCLLFFFCFASIMLIALGRTWFFGPEQALLSRYRMYAFLMLLMVGNIFLVGDRRKFVAILLLMIGLIIQLSSVRVLPAIEKNRSDVAQSYYNWLIDGGMGRTAMTFYPHNQDFRLFYAYERGYYNPYAAINNRHKPASVTLSSDSICAEGAVTADAPMIHAWSKKTKAIASEISLDGLPVSSVGGTVFFCSDKANYAVTVDARNINAQTGKFWPQIVLKRNLPPAQYRVFWRSDSQQARFSGDVSFP
jgi:hypothetical protein